MSILTKNKEKSSSVQQLRELRKVMDIPINLIRPNPNQPRKHFDPASLTSLAKSISQDGIIQPLTVRITESHYELVSGERRLRAAKLAGLRSVPCILIDISDERSAVVALIENIQRADLSFFEEAMAISHLIKEYGMTQENTAIRLGMAQSTLANKLRLLKLSPTERQIITKNNLSERHARALLKLQNEDERKRALAFVIENNLNVEATEKYIANFENKEKIKASYKKRSPILRDVKLFFNTVNKAVNVMKLAGVDAQVKKSHHDGLIEYTILIPDENTDNVPRGT
ncbi:MAG: ParB/RepB/Spo0J family partition protein [Ruminococcus sp.]|nr:ParB/RepB/Spo0J family partition protein [Ruminococcus sp.]